MSRVAAVILAAGASTRLGTPKQLALLVGETLLARAVRVATEAACAPVLVVLGANAELISASGPFHDARLVVNPTWPEGMASSIRAGLQALAGQVDGTILMTCDQPAVTPAHLRQLATRNPDEVTASAYANRRGVPAYFPSRLFPQLLALTGDEGARTLLQIGATLPLPNGELDIDTPHHLSLAQTLYDKP